MLGRTPGGCNLQSVNEYDDIAIAIVAIQVAGVVTVGHLGGAYLASESGIAATETIRQMAINIVANKELLMVNVFRLQHSLTSGEGLAYALAKSANTSGYPAWLLTRGAAIVAPPTITVIVD